MNRTARRSAASSTAVRREWSSRRPICSTNSTGVGPGTSRHVTQRREPDTVEILSGVFEGRTTGTPIALLIRNEDQRSKDYANIADTFRPGHADYTYWHKYGIRDYRGGGRQSARETAVRVAAGAIAKKWLRERYGVTIRGHLTHLGPNAIAFEGWEHVDANPFFIANASRVAELEAFMDRLRKSGDSVRRAHRGRRERRAGGLGRAGVRQARRGHRGGDDGHQRGEGRGDRRGIRVASRSAAPSTPTRWRRKASCRTTRAASWAASPPARTCASRIAVKPTSSIRLDRHSIDKAGRPVVVNTHGRHDPCVGIRATPIAEAMLALVLIDHALRHRAQNADVRVDTPRLAAQAPADVAARIKRAPPIDDPDPDEA